MAWHNLPDTASLTDWCTAYRFCKLDVTIRGGEYVGLWIGEHILAVDAGAVVGEKILDQAATPTLAYADRHGAGLLLLATRDMPPSSVEHPDVDVRFQPAVFRLPTGHPADPYLWRVTPDVAIRPLSELIAVLGAAQPE